MNCRRGAPGCFELFDPVIMQVPHFPAESETFAHSVGFAAHQAAAEPARYGESVVPIAGTVRRPAPIAAQQSPAPWTLEL